MDPATEAAPVSRRERRKAETRARLLEAARAVFARQGVDSTRINEITDEADVGFGSFYNHFESKDAIVGSVVEVVAGEIAEAIDRATADVEDVAEVVAIAHRTLVRRAAEDTNLGWLLVRLEVSHDLVFAVLGPYAARDLKRGLRAGRFAVGDANVALIAAGGALLAVVRAVLQERAAADAGAEHAAGVLRMFGVPAEEAAQIAARPLPRA